MIKSTDKFVLPVTKHQTSVQTDNRSVLTDNRSVLASNMSHEIPNFRRFGLHDPLLCVCIYVCWLTIVRQIVISSIVRHREME
jgi:hypothetical protein